MFGQSINTFDRMIQMPDPSDDVCKAGPDFFVFNDVEGTA